MSAELQLQVSLELPLDRFSLQVEFTTTHRVTGVFGASGAGKTSLLETIAGIRRGARGRIAFGGQVWLDGDRRTFVRPERRGIGFVPQDGLIFPHLDVRGNLLAGAARARRDDATGDATFDTTVRLLELSTLLERDVTTLSGGERQRVALGRALCSGPRLLLLDEPLAAVDVPLRRRVLPFLRRVRDEFRIPMLVVTHDPVEVQALCDDLIVLRQGAILARGAPGEVLTDPAVFPIAEREGYRNLLPCTLVASEGHTSVVQLGHGESAPRIVVPRTSADRGETMLIGIRAQDVILAIHEPHGLSARNVLPATVVSVEQVSDLWLVRVSLGDDTRPIAVEVTEQACRALELAPGRAVHVILKTAGCEVYHPDRREETGDDRPPLARSQSR